MRIVKLGKISLPWWIGRTVKCCECETRFKLDINDQIETELVKGAHPHNQYIFTCGICHELVSFEEADKKIIETKKYYKI